MTSKLSRRSGYSLIEMVVVVTIVGIMIAVGVPAITHYVRSVRVRTAAVTLAQNLSHCRYMSVTNRTPRSLDMLGSLPVAAYTFVDIKGNTKTVELALGVEITSASNFPATFTTLGGLQGAPATAVIKGPIDAQTAHEITLTVDRTGKVSMTFNLNATP